MNKTVSYSVVLCLIVIGGSFFYYYVIFLPGQQRILAEQERQEKQIKEEDGIIKETERVANERIQRRRVEYRHDLIASITTAITGVLSKRV